MITDKEARKLGVGGEVLAFVMVSIERLFGRLILYKQKLKTERAQTPFPKI